MTRRSHTILGGLALGAGLLAAAAPAAALTPPVDPGIGPGGFAPNDPLVSIDDSYAYEADGVIRFDIHLSKPSDQVHVVNVARSNGSTSDDDFEGLATPLAIFTPGVTSSSVLFAVAEGDDEEAPEDFTAEIVSVSNGLVINDGTATGTIYDADGPVLGASMDQVDEGDPGDDVHLEVEVELSYAPPDDVDFDLHTQVVGFGAVPGEDFTPVDGTFTVPAGSTSTIVPIQVVSDDVVDDDDGVVMAIASNPSIGSTWDNTAVGKILDDDEPGDAASASGSDGEDQAVVGDDATTTTTTLGDDSTEEALAAGSRSGRSEDGSGLPLPLIGGVAALLAGTWGLLHLRSRRQEDEEIALRDATREIRLD